MQIDLVGSSFDTLLALYVHTGVGFGVQLGSNDDCISLASCLDVPLLYELAAPELRVQVWWCMMRFDRDSFR